MSSTPYYYAIESEMYVRAYQMIGQQIDELFSVKYKNNNRFAKFIYYGYDNMNAGPQSEDSTFVLIDKSVQSWKFCKTLQEVIQFLGLLEEQEIALKQDIEELVQHEDKISIILKDRNLPQTIIYSRMLRFIKNVLD